MPGWETLYTAEFVRAALPPRADRLLEIGCGAGELAALLGAGGLEVVAVDSDESCVAMARHRGVDAHLAEWPNVEPGQFDGGRFDAILFTRSLHHVGDLGRSVAAAFGALRPNGRILVEDFAFEEADEATLAWFRSFAALLRGTGVLGEGCAFVDGLVAAEPPLADWWRRQHDHDLHTAASIGAALRAHPARLESSGAAYYFRYFLPVCASAAWPALLDHELALIHAGLIRPLGRRWIAFL